MTHKFPAKSDQDILDEKFDWSNWLAAGETISTAVLTVAPTGALTLSNISHDSSSVTFHVSGGVVGQTYAIACTITTSAGNTALRTGKITVKAL